MQCSIVVPIYNEIAILSLFLKRLGELVKSWQAEGIKVEIILVDDGSIDGSLEIMKKFAPIGSQIIVLAYNYGQSIALNAGLDQANGKYVFTLDADLEFEPFILKRFLSKLMAGYDLVSGVRVIRKSSFFRKIASFNINLLGRTLLGTSLRDLSCPVNGYSRLLLENLKKQGSLLFVKVKAARCASKVAEVPIEQQGRRSGYSKYNLLKLFCLFLEFVIHHSRHIFGRIIIFGVGLLLSSLVAGGIYLFLRILQTIPSSPVFQAIIILMFFTGWQTLIIGFVGEYLRRLYRLFEGNFSSYRVQEVIKIK